MKTKEVKTRGESRGMLFLKHLVQTTTRSICCSLEKIDQHLDMIQGPNILRTHIHGSRSELCQRLAMIFSDPAGTRLDRGKSEKKSRVSAQKRTQATAR
jgi:hypothetical protein